MQLERMAVRLRPRNPWEALDLGLALVRAKAARIYGAWFLVYTPPAVLLIAILHENPFYAWLILWWLKPAFDRAVLAVLAHDMFGGESSVRSLVGNPRHWLFGNGLLASLTWRRFNLARSFHLPVRQLERARGKAARERIRVLDRDARGAASWLTFLLFNMELFLSIAASLAIAFLLPVQAPLETLFEEWIAQQTEESTAALLAGTLLSVLAVSLIEPVYVAAGFTLYLQRRTMLEGWDIELRFRQLSERVAQAPATPPRAIVASLAMVATAFTLAFASPDAGANEPGKDAELTSAAPSSSKAALAIKEVLAHPDFGKPDIARSIRFVGPEWKRDKKDDSRPWDLKWLEDFARFAAEAARFIAWAVGAAVIALILYYLARHIRLRYTPARRAARPDFLFGLDVRPESLPEDVAATAAGLAREGRAREALSLLYRGALVRFLDQGMEFLAGDTEGDCLRRVESLGEPPAREYFARLVSAWQTLAYGHRAVPGETILALADGWRAQFSSPR